MINLDKNEYVYLMIVRTKGTSRRAIDYNVNPFKTANDVEHAILNVIANNIKNCKNDIVYMHYNAIGTTNEENFGYAEIGYKNGISKIYTAVRRKIQEVK